MKITPTGVNEALKSLQSNRFYPLSEMSHYPNLAGGVVKGTGLQPAPAPPPPNPANPAPLSRSRQASSPQLGAAADATSLHPSFADITAANISRSRSPSIKRKDLEVSANDSSHSNRSKQARYDSGKASSLKAAAEKLVYARTGSKRTHGCGQQRPRASCYHL